MINQEAWNAERQKLQTQLEQTIAALLKHTGADAFSFPLRVDARHTHILVGPAQSVKRFAEGLPEVQLDG